MALEPEELWKGGCVVEEIRFVSRYDGKKEVIFVLRDDGAAAPARPAAVCDAAHRRRKGGSYGG